MVDIKLEAEKLRVILLKDLEDLKQKIKSNEPLPHKEQDYKTLCDIHDNIEQCLNNWYY